MGRTATILHQEYVTTQRFTIDNLESFASQAELHFKTMVQLPTHQVESSQAWTDLRRTKDNFLYVRKLIHVLGPTTTNTKGLCLLSYVEKGKYHLISGMCDRDCNRAVYKTELGKRLSKKSRSVKSVEVGFAFVGDVVTEEGNYEVEVMKFKPLVGWFHNLTMRPHDPPIKHTEELFVRDMKTVNGLTTIVHPTAGEKSTRNPAKKRKNEVTAEDDENIQKVAKLDESQLIVEVAEESICLVDTDTVNMLFNDFGHQPIHPKQVNDTPNNYVLPISSDNDGFDCDDDQMNESTAMEYLKLMDVGEPLLILSSQDVSEWNWKLLP